MRGWMLRSFVISVGLAAALLLTGCPESEEAGAGAVDAVSDIGDDTGGGGPCLPACDWRECGPDPQCGRSCGACAPGEICDKGSCIPPGCVPDCSQVDCGPDPVCGSYCGGCGAGLTCSDGACVEGTCEPQCGRRECGPDPVCQESCGVCAEGTHCLDGTCVEGACEPQCGERACGPDPRCGESCGTCGAGETCQAGVCVPDGPCECDPPCGDGFVCDPDTCRCAPVGVCDPPCEPPEVCVDGACVCAPECQDRECGPDPVCGVLCGACAEGEACVDGFCRWCEPQCGDRECGPDPLCGESCGVCDAGFQCSERGRCVPEGCEPLCGDRQCGPDPVCGENCGVCEAGCVCSADGRCLCEVQGACANADDLAILNGVDATDLVMTCVLNLECPEPECYADCIRRETGISNDCAACYGELTACGLENCAQRCLADEGGPECLACLDVFCMTAFEQCAGIELAQCEPQCGDRECGPDPVCGESCGTCGPGLRCDAGRCVEGPCEPQCGDRQCGLDPVCGISCGMCPRGLHCEEGRCVEGPCEPDCTDRECGPDPVCGLPCGFCPPGTFCEQGICAEGPCEPQCGDRECGPDPVCGQPCGFCPDGERCRQGVCEPFEPPQDACNNDRDLALLNDLDAVAVAQTCLVEGGCGFTDRPCITRCIVEQTGLSGACASCFSGLAICGAANCLAPCLADPGGPTCLGCLTESCLADFEACSGVTWNPGCTPDCANRECGPDPVCGLSCGACDEGSACVDGICKPVEPPPGDACDNAQDLAILNQTDAQAVAEACLFGAGCGADEACLADCIQEQTGISAGCAACYGELAVCGLNACLMACFDDPAGETCVACLNDACLPAFEACSGITWAGGGTCTPQCDGVECGDDGCGGSCGACPAGETCQDGRCAPFPEGACADAENLGILAQVDFGQVVFACVQCLGDTACLTDCVQDQTGLSSGCAFCVAITADCAAGLCLNACLTDPQGEACLGCVAEQCGADFEACAGIPLPF